LLIKNKKKNEKRERLEEEDKKEYKKKKKNGIKFCASKISNYHIPSNSNLKNSIFLEFKSEIP
jgi:hypothetical protein